MQVVILCGGKGVRAFPFTKYLPKPLLPLRGSPIIVQVIKSFVSQGINDFILAAGFGKSNLDDYFEGKDLGAKINIVDTGDDTDTGGRLYACKDLLNGSFIATYADGLSDVPLRCLIDFHNSHEGLMTITAAPMYSQYGVLEIDEEGKIIEMKEKPLIDGLWVNAGFIVFDTEVFNHWEGENLEKEVIPNLIKKGLGFSYRHRGFFKSADSYQDIVDFEELMGDDGSVPWAVKEDS